MQWPFWYSLKFLSVIILVLIELQRHTAIRLHRSSCKVSILLSYFNESWIFWTYFRKTLKYHIPWKSAEWQPSRSVRRSRQRDRQKWRNLQSLRAILWERLKKKFQKAPICSKNVFLRFGIFSGGEKNRHISVRHCNGDVIVAFRVATEFFHMTYVKFDFKWLTFENIPVTAAQWLLA